jgi:xanthine dehydrogenase accessory factor
MLVNDQAEYLGQITGGCAEMAIADQAVMTISERKNITLRYGLDSPFFDIRLPCGSGIDVYFDCDITVDNLLAIANKLESRQVYVQSLNTGIGQFDRRYLPSTRLVLVGQGPILVLLAQLAIKSGFDVACISQNEYTEGLLHQAKLKSVGLHATNKAFACEFDNFTAMVSLFHEHDLETSLLSDALSTSAFYIGALGSQRTHATRLDNLKRYGVDDQELNRIHGPVGLDIGANTPAHIAVSILAEIITHLNRSRNDHSYQ